MKSRPSLFEVINKAPQAQPGFGATKRPSLLGGRRRSNSTRVAQPLVAQALTEEEAANELAARREQAEAEARVRQEAKERVEREKEARRQAKIEKKAAKLAAREAARQRAAELAAQRAADRATRAPAPKTGQQPRPLIRSGRGGFSFSLTTANCMMVGGGLAAVLFAVYAIGHRSGADSDSAVLTKVAALSHDPGTEVKAATGRPAVSTAKTRSAAGDRELSELLTPPASVKQNVMANQPVRVDQESTAAAPDKTKLNHVQIEWFQISVEKSGEDLKADVEDVHRFLKARGVETYARQHAKGFILYSATGFRMSREFRAEREAFLKRLQKLGQEYFRGGGRYQFKDCFFVSYNNATKGEPVSFKE